MSTVKERKSLKRWLWWVMIMNRVDKIRVSFLSEIVGKSISDNTSEYHYNVDNPDGKLTLYSNTTWVVFPNTDVVVDYKKFKETYINMKNNLITFPDYEPVVLVEEFKVDDMGRKILKLKSAHHTTYVAERLYKEFKDCTLHIISKTAPLVATYNNEVIGGFLPFRVR